MKTKSILLIFILIFCSCVADENEQLINNQYLNKDQQFQLKNTIIVPNHDILQIPNLDIEEILGFSNLIFIGKEF